MDDTSARAGGYAHIANNSALQPLSSVALPVPSLGADDVHVRVSAIGVNYIDYLVTSSSAASARVTPGCEATGRIVALGKSVSNYSVGQRVVVFAMGGCYATDIVAHRRFVIPVPGEVDDVTAAAFLISYATANLALRRRAVMRAGETVVITGAAGATGLAAVELAAHWGATVIACAGSHDKLIQTRQAGASFGINYRQEHVPSRLAEYAPSGFDVLIDTVSGPMLGELAAVAGFGARICLVGATAGELNPVDPMTIITKQLNVLGIALGAHRDAHPQQFAEDTSELLSLLARRVLRPRVSRILPFSSAAAALDLIVRRENVGKIVLQVDTRPESG